MRIALIVPGFSADPSDWCIPALRDLVRQLATTTDVHVFALRYPARRSRYELFGAQVTALGGAETRRLKSASLWRRTARAIAAEHRVRRFDVLHAFWAGEPGFVAVLTGRLLGIPTVVSLAGGELARLPDIDYGGRLHAVERIKTWLALRLASMVTAGSALTLAAARPWLGARHDTRAMRIPLGVDLFMFAPAEPQPTNGVPRIVQVASLVPVKDQLTLLRAAALLRERGSRFALELVGAGPLEPELRSHIRRLGIEDVVALRGAIAHDALPVVYQRAHLFVLSSRHEAQGMAALEAAACGIPVVGTNVGIIPELAPDAARVTPVGDARAMADGIAGFLDDEEIRTRSGRFARALVEAEYGLEQSARRYLGVYADLARAPAVSMVGA